MLSMRLSKVRGEEDVAGEGRYVVVVVVVMVRSIVAKKWNKFAEEAEDESSGPVVTL